GAELDEIEMSTDFGGSQRPGLDRGEAPRDRVGPERLAFGRANRVGGDAGRHRGQNPFCGPFNLPAIVRPDKREKLAGSFKTRCGREPILPGTSVPGSAMAQTAQLQRAAHPLDPLSEAEVALASDILRAEKQLGADIRFTHVQLEEPAKADVLGWREGSKPGRRAAATLFDCRTGATHLATVDLASRKVVAWQEHFTKVHPYGQPPVTIEEVFKVGDIVKRDSGWR